MNWDTIKEILEEIVAYFKKVFAYWENQENA